MKVHVSCEKRESRKQRIWGGKGTRLETEWSEVKETSLTNRDNHVAQRLKAQDQSLQLRWTLKRIHDQRSIEHLLDSDWKLHDSRIWWQGRMSIKSKKIENLNWAERTHLYIVPITVFQLALPLSQVNKETPNSSMNSASSQYFNFWKGGSWNWAGLPYGSATWTSSKFWQCWDGLPMEGLTKMTGNFLEGSIRLKMSQGANAKMGTTRMACEEKSEKGELSLMWSRNKP